MIDDADIEQPIPTTRPGKATHKAPDATKPTAAKAAAAVATEADKAELVELVTDKPFEILTDNDKREALYARLRKMVAEQKPDLSTEAGRSRVKSFVYKIVRTRTALDAAGKEANAGLRAQINEVDAMRRNMEAAMKAIEEEARRPLTEWEKAEAKRDEQRRGVLQDIAKAISWASRETPPVTAEECRELIDMVEAVTIDAQLWGDETDAMTKRRSEAITILNTKLEAVELREKLAAAQAEAESLRNATRADDNAPSLDPVIEQRELPPVMDDQRDAPPAPRNDPPAAEAGAPALTPIQQARRRALPALHDLGITGDTAKALILAVERGEIPGITATYLENDQ